MHVLLLRLDISKGQWNVASGDAEIFKGKGHMNQVSDMVLCGDNLVTCSMDDTVRLTSVQALEYRYCKIFKPV